MNRQNINTLRKPTKLIENRTQFAGPESEVSIYDTYEAASRVDLHADQVLYCGMISGKKVMHSPGCDEQIFLPHESFIMAPGTSVEIDFPEANKSSPTSCLTVEISKEKIASVAECMNESFPLDSIQREWNYDTQVLHTSHSTATQRLLTRLLTIFTENHPDKNMLIDLNISELIIRMMRKQEREFLLSHCSAEPDANSLTEALSCIKKNLAKGLSIEELCQIACMSRSRLYYEFKNKLGCSPAELQQQLRLKEATKRLRRGDVITTICYDLGFSSPSHFSRRFKCCFGCTPTEYRNKYFASNNLPKNTF
ncbi:MAG: AraC family transcriptional regulator [uncultured Thiotrichaceae bacterium]|uniref:AraC family transcriptional regulator n=1 Tax=uncultured Thiotrichaceae bacterium TaxID=298394 RepID=A0A6S6U7P4_9GAMM|nr:MAG: AraC family transcriptional regulator [uncultured Thiotrichaceae bacterium]